jgi:hypothetical protein
VAKISVVDEMSKSSSPIINGFKLAEFQGPGADLESLEYMIL